MLALIDSRSPLTAVKKIHEICRDVYEFPPTGLAERSIEAHPDIFVFEGKSKYVVAPNAPKSLFEFLEKYQIVFSHGKTNIDFSLHNSVAYNCIETENFFFHKKKFTDSVVAEIVANKNIINLPQAFTACSLVSLNDKTFLTSDRGIEKILLKNCFDCFYFPPEEIGIVDHSYGFLGGACGIFRKTIYFNGNPLKHAKGIDMLGFIEKIGFQTEFLHNDFLYDGGKIIFIEENGQ